MIHIRERRWYAEQKPFPRSTVIAKRMGVEPRTVQRSLKKLSDLGLVQRYKEAFVDEERVVCDLSGLVQRLAVYAQADPDYQLRASRKKETPDAVQAV
ncbi:helix-turn-helix domain-containing protein [Agrobacterium cavarae]|uniref:helix-turn-helix domain-containing protein n=1 Tax=Agrobacterium cavarae TaxID=2528239 RepID=UPI003EE5209E